MRNPTYFIRAIASVAILLGAAQSGRAQEAAGATTQISSPPGLETSGSQNVIPRLHVFWSDTSQRGSESHELHSPHANADIVSSICSRLSGTDSRVGVTIWMETLDGNTLPILAELKQLESLSIVGSSFRVGQLKAISKCPRLKHLNLDACRISVDDCRELASFPNLEVLQLSGAGVSDAGLKHLSRIPALTELDLRGTQVSDAGLVPLKNCRTLRLLDLRGTAVTTAGANRLNRMLPGLRIQLQPVAPTSHSLAVRQGHSVSTIR